MTRFLIHVLISIGVVIFFYPAFSEEDEDKLEGALYQWRLQLLLATDEDAQLRERNGFIFSYSRLKDMDIEQAMDENYFRIDTMVFINTISTDEQDEAMIDPCTGQEISDDDC